MSILPERAEKSGSENGVQLLRRARRPYKSGAASAAHAKMYPAGLHGLCKRKDLQLLQRCAPAGYYVIFEISEIQHTRYHRIRQN